jgi:hypothetical protein
VPYLRFARDPRGYESTSVLHTFRRSGRNRSRILYWFRTPPNVKVGRAPLDEEAIREIEKHHPDLEFDWTKILETQPPAQAPVERPERRTRRGARPGESGRAERTRRRPRGEQPMATTAAPAESSAAVTVPVDDLIATPVEAQIHEASGFRTDVEPLAVGQLEPAAPAPADAGSAGLMPDWDTDDADVAPSQLNAVEELVGSEGLARLRARHAEIQARITERGGDPAAVLELRRRAEILDPDTWVTREEARQALEHYETRLEEFRRLLGPRRRRSRRGGRRRRGPQKAGPSSAFGADGTGEASKAGGASADDDEAGAASGEEDAAAGDGSETE